MGDAPPALKVARWIKGTPVESFAPGKTYAIGFWATTCRPCIVGILHLTKLAHDYAGKVTFVGVSTWEKNPEDIDSVAKFVTTMGDKMDYTVAADGPDESAATTWMKAARVTGIPAVLLVGPDGKIDLFNSSGISSILILVAQRYKKFLRAVSRPCIKLGGIDSLKPGIIIVSDLSSPNVVSYLFS